MGGEVCMLYARGWHLWSLLWMRRRRSFAAHGANALQSVRVDILHPCGLSLGYFPSVLCPGGDEFQDCAESDSTLCPRSLCGLFGLPR